mmetsp:Transcript_110536/g.226143  ORF Transcript_110536/g.226143 Transcript_110536/m.226143 type:complete len:370 (+) Transcript_110536:1602-2711(+)
MEMFQDQPQREEAPPGPFFRLSLVLYTLSALFCIGSTAFVWCYRKNTVVRLSQPYYLITMFLGAFLVASSGLFLVGSEWIDGDKSGDGNPRDALCCAWIWFFVLGTNLVYMALFGKLWRIQKVTKMKKNQAITVGQTIWPLRVMCLLNVAILVAWTVVDPPSYETFDGNNNYDNDNDNDSNETATEEAFVQGTCDFVQLPFFVPLQVVVFVSASLGLYMTHRTKDLPEELREGAKIFAVYAGHLLAFLVSGSLYWAGRFRHHPSVATMNASMLVATVCTSVSAVAPIALPKMHCVWYESRHGRLPEGTVRTIGRGTTRVGTVAAGGGTATAAPGTGGGGRAAEGVLPPPGDAVPGDPGEGPPGARSEEA